MSCKRYTDHRVREREAVMEVRQRCESGARMCMVSIAFFVREAWHGMVWVLFAKEYVKEAIQCGGGVPSYLLDTSEYLPS